MRDIEQPLEGRDVATAAGLQQIAAKLDSCDLLVGACSRLGASTVPVLSTAEMSLLSTARDFGHGNAPNVLRDLVLEGLDPLGDAYLALRAAPERRRSGATYTPPTIVQSMIDWVGSRGIPDRIVDPGAGSGRFTLAAGRRFPVAELVAIEIDPIAALVTRANLAAARLGHRSRVLVTDYRIASIPPIAGCTAFVGNPPYVRHHHIGDEGKQWLTRTATAMGLKASQLAGLHAHFILATARHARPGDVGCFITSAEWLDVNYGSLVRELFLNGMGATALHVVEPKSLAFEGTATTAVIACFQVGRRVRSFRVRAVADVKKLNTLVGGRLVTAAQARETSRWSSLLHPPRRVPPGWVELGDFCDVHRGGVTGANRIWITRPGDQRVPITVLYPSVTDARELLDIGETLSTTAHLRLVIDIPSDLSVFTAGDRRRIDRFLSWAKANCAADGYIASHRKPWWSVRLPPPAPILATYMARRPPAFVRNLANARHVNIAHGIYPRIPLTPVGLDKLAAALRGSTTVLHGRTYAGGLTKFEPKEMERLFVPDPAELNRL